jgi:anti-anti-sigma factor
MGFDEILQRYNEGHPHALVGFARSEGGDIALSLSGELEMKASSDIGPLLDYALRECPARTRLVLDLRGVGYISSTGVGLLATLMVSADKRSITLVLLDIPPRVRNIMDTLGLTSFFNVEESGE